MKVFVSFSVKVPKKRKTKRPLYLYVKEFDKDLFGRKNILESPNAD